MNYSEVESSNEPRLTVRPLTIDDYDAIADIQRRCFPDIAPWPKAEFATHLREFPEGQIGIEFDQQLVATSSSLIVNGEDFREPHTFYELTADFSESHDPEGDTLYGIDIAVDPEYRGMRLARRLYEARKDLVQHMNLHGILIAGRMPEYHNHAPEMSAYEYVRRVLGKQFQDPVITAQVANGFNILRVIPNYLPSDAESCGYAVLMEWNNPEYAPETTRRPGTGIVRVANVQYQMREIDSFDEFKKQCKFFIETAGDYRSDFLVFPELITNQLMALVKADRPGVTARHLDRFTESYVEFFTDMAMKYYVNIIAGSHLTMDNDALYNIAWLFRRDGSTGRQRKIHITPSESRWWGISPGDKVEVFDTDRGKIAILICYDIEFPELGRIAASKGARIFFVPYNTDIRPGHLRVRSCAQARCIENHVYAVLSGAVGNLPFVEGADIHYAQSCILTPSDIAFSRDGVGAEATPNVETMLVHELDLDTLRRTRRTGTVRTWLDRRLDLYQVKYREGDDTFTA